MKGNLRNKNFLGPWNDLNFADQAEQIAQYDFSSDHETETQADLNSNITSNAINGIKEYQSKSEETKPVIRSSSGGAGKIMIMTCTLPVLKLMNALLCVTDER